MNVNYLLIDNDVKPVVFEYIYMIKSGEYLKVGVSNDPKRRLEQINHYRFDCELIYTSAPLINGRFVEYNIHKRLKDILVQGKEWYMFNDREKIRTIIDVVIKEHGKLADKYKCANYNQKQEYLNNGIKIFKEQLNAINYAIAKQKLQTIANIGSSLMHNLYNIDLKIYCYNRKFFINSYILYDNFDDINNNYEYYEFSWDNEMIKMCDYNAFEDYIDCDMTNGMCFSIEAAKELCLLINNEKSINLRSYFVIFEQTMRELFPDYFILCDSCREIISSDDFEYDI